MPTPPGLGVSPWWLPGGKAGLDLPHFSFPLGLDSRRNLAHFEPRRYVKYPKVLNRHRRPLACPPRRPILVLGFLASHATMTRN